MGGAIGHTRRGHAGVGGHNLASGEGALREEEDRGTERVRQRDGQIEGRMDGWMDGRMGGGGNVVSDAVMCFMWLNYCFLSAVSRGVLCCGCRGWTDWVGRAFVRLSA